jgi:hypothetical protein
MGNPFSCIADIQSLFDRWRALGSHVLPCGTELIAGVEDVEPAQWLHVVYPGLDSREVDALERSLHVPVPRLLRAFYRRCAGMELWHGLFCVYGYRPANLVMGDELRFPPDALRFNHLVQSMGWLPPKGFAFAQNSWDLSVHVVGLDDDPEVVHRCALQTGERIETHESIWLCLAMRLNRIDQLAL